MKKMILLSLFCVVVQIFSVTIDGYAFLEGETDHSGIEVFFQRVVPDTLANSTVYTDSIGYYTSIVEDGWYDIKYSYSGFTSMDTADVSLYSDQTLNDQFLSLPGMSGSIFGVLPQGNYAVTGTITVEMGDSLVIEPGVILNFDPGTEFNVFGYLKAEGTKTDKIHFRASDTSWDGMNIDNAEAVISEFIYEGTSWVTRITLSQAIVNIANSTLTNIEITASSTLNLDNCVLKHLLINSSNVSVYNSTFDNYSPGIDFNGGSLIVNNCVIVSYMYGIYSSGATLSVEYSNIFSTGTGDGFSHFDGCGSYLGVIVTTNANGDPCDAYNNISMDPKFGTDLTLMSDSPCIDAGTNTISGYELPDTDIDGYFRIWDGDGNSSDIIDMGAYEYGAEMFINSPSNATINVVSNTLTINWDSMSGANSYYIYHSDNPYDTFTQIDSVSTNFWNTSIDSNTKKFYQIVASSDGIK